MFAIQGVSSAQNVDLKQFSKKQQHFLITKHFGMKYKLFISGMRVLFAGLMIFSLATGIAFSQEKTIQIVGKNTSAPVSDVYFKYGDKTGFSGDSGEISIEFSEKESLWLSHLLYGRIWLSPEEVKLSL